MTKDLRRVWFESEAARLRPVIMRIAVRITLDEEDAADVTQETLLRLWHLRDRLSEYNSIEAVARTIARNLSLNYVRDRHSSSSVEVHGDFPDTATAEEGYTDEVSDELLDAIKALPDRDQMILRMKHIDELEIEEICRIIRVSPGAVRTALSRARKRIRELFLKNWNRI